MRSRTRSSSRPGSTDSSSARASPAAGHRPPAPEARELRQLAGLADREDQAERFRLQTSRNERERQRRRVVQPLCIVDYADERPALGNRRQQTEHAQTDDKAIGSLFRAQAECRRERITLRSGQALPEIKHRAAQLMQTRIGQVHLGLNAGSSRDAAPGRVRNQVLQQRRLARPRLATQDQHLTLTRPHALQQSIEGVTLAASPKQRWSSVTRRNPLALLRHLAVASCERDGIVAVV